MKHHQSLNMKKVMMTKKFMYEMQEVMHQTNNLSFDEGNTEVSSLPPGQLFPTTPPPLHPPSSPPHPTPTDRLV